MEDFFDFEKIGKEVPYKVPDGFFEQNPERTLQKARQRTQDRRKRLILWRSVALTAAAVVLLLLYLPHHQPKPKTGSVAQKTAVPEQPSVRMPEQTLTRTAPITVSKKPALKEDTGKMNSGENIEDVLNDLSDEELLDLEAMNSTDPYIDALSQEPINVN